MSRTVWRQLEYKDHEYVPRCSFCGHFKKVLLSHWFYTGLYCMACIQDILYDNARNIKEIDNNEG